MNRFVWIGVCALLGFSFLPGAAVAAGASIELGAVKAGKQDETRIPVHFKGGGEVVGVQFDLALDNKRFGKVDLSDCVAALPSSHMGNCSRLADGRVRVLVFSPGGEKLPSGAIGSIGVQTKGAALKRGWKPELVNVVLSDAQAEPVPHRSQR